MPLKIMCAGCSKDERDAAEAMVKAALGTAAGSWMVSLVKIGRQWSVTIDGPEIKHKTVVVPDGSIPQALRDLLPAPSPPAAMPRAPLPPTTTPPTSRPVVPRPTTAPTVATRAPAPPAMPARTTPPSLPRPTVPAPARPVIPGAPRPAAPAPSRPANPTALRPPTPTVRPTVPAPRGPALSAGGMGRAPAPPRSPSSPTRGGVRQDRYDCQYCGGAFVVIYESPADSPQETVAVACPHCWKNSHVMISEEAALTRDYRAEKI